MLLAQNLAVFDLRQRRINNYHHLMNGLKKMATKRTCSLKQSENSRHNNNLLGLK
jgi:hypothetical protein